MNALDRIRHTVARYMVAFVAIHIAVVAAIGLLRGIDTLAALLGAAAVAAVTAAVWWFDRGGAQTRHVSAVALMLMVGLIVYSMRGHAWQIDVHMYFFACLAILAAFCDWRTIVVAAATVAIHHLVLNVAFPEAVFPNGADTSRVILHAIIVVIEAATLIWLASRLVDAFAQSEEAIGKAVEAERETKHLSARQQEIERQAADEKRQALVGLADTLEAKVGEAVRKISDGISHMRGQAQAMSKLAQTSRAQSESAANRTGQATSHAQAVAAATQEMSASIAEIAEQMTHAQTISEDAVRRAEMADATVRRLVETATKIGQVTGLIAEIAEQTNLLALNATIEAARAGEAGKGFAVVASEVKNLATQTAKATEDVSSEIGKMQMVSEEAGQAINQISKTIDEINQVATTIAAATEEQTSAVRDIERNTTQAADGTRDATEEVRTLAGAVDSTESAVQQVADATERLDVEIQAIDKQIAGFLDQVRSA